MSPSEVALLYIMRVFFGIAGIALTIGFIDAVVRVGLFLYRRSRGMLVIMVLMMMALMAWGFHLWLHLR